MTKANPTLVKEKERLQEIRQDLLQEHKGEFVLFKGIPHGFYPSFEEAYAAGIDRFGLDELFLIEELVDRAKSPGRHR